MSGEYDAIVIGGGLAGLVATGELAAAGRRVALLDQEPEASLGGQTFWSFGGLFLVDSPEQRPLRIRDSHELAWQDWLGAAAEKRAWLREQGVRLLPMVGWAERGGYGAIGHGNSVPRFHIAWGTGPGVVTPFARRAQAAAQRGLVDLRFRHRVDKLLTSRGAVEGVRGKVLAPDSCARGQSSNRDEAADFELRAPIVIVTSGGIGGNHELVRKNWPARLGKPPRHMISGVPAHVDGRMIQITQKAGGTVINPDRMWHYTEGIRNWDPIWPMHGIRILPGPSSLWLDATGRRLPVPLFPGFDTLGTLEHIMRTGHEHTWFVLTQQIIEKEFALSGSEQNPDITDRSVRDVLASRVGKGAPEPVEAFKRHGADFVVDRDLRQLVAGMNALTNEPLLDYETVEREVVARDREMANPFAKDLQVVAIRGARRYLADRISRVAAPHRFLDPRAGPLIAVHLWILTRKSLGGLESDLSGRVLKASGEPLPGVYAAGEVAGFGGGGMHGYRSLEGTFLGGCLFSGRTTGRAAAAALG